MSSGTEPASTGVSARSDSIASFACSKSRPSGSSFAYPSWATVGRIESSRSDTFSCRMCSSSSSGERSPSSATDDFLGTYLLRVDLLERRAVLEARDLALGRVRGGHGQGLRGAELLGDGPHPLDQLLERRARGPHLMRAEVDQLTAQTPANRAPEVLLDLTMLRVEQLLALVDRPCDARRQCVRERRERDRLVLERLRVADPDLDGREREVRAHRPPHLGVLVDRARVEEEADVVLERLPVAVRVRHAAARKELREDLRAHGLQTRVDLLEERRAGREREQLGQVRAQGVADLDRAVGAVDRDVD